MSLAILIRLTDGLEDAAYLHDLIHGALRLEVVVGLTDGEAERLRELEADLSCKLRMRVDAGTNCGAAERYLTESFTGVFDACDGSLVCPA